MNDTQVGGESKPKAEDLAYDNWPDILTRAGMDSAFFSGRKGPCPFCGGRDRYRWKKDYGGVWVCNGCGDGKFQTGFAMLMQLRGYRHFWEAADHVREHFGGFAPDPVVLAARREAAPSREEQHKRNMRRMVEIWEASRPVIDNDPVHRYLQHRVPGLTIAPRMIRLHPALDYWAPPDDPNEKPVLLGKFPAMIAKAFDPGGAFVQLHKTYLTAEGRKADVPMVKKNEKGIGINGFAVPIMEVTGDTLGFAEGIESALAAAMLRQVPVWPCLNGPSMAAFDLPTKLIGKVKRAMIFEDHDELKQVAQGRDAPPRYRRAGSHYAAQLATRLRAHGVRVMLVKAAKAGFDMADYWEQRHKRDLTPA
ncbi:zinc-binding protein [Caenimonas sedimenti]|uniref:Zinc-binding protein n=2 Tax=Caenimonas sedimenti TaxID=2596921 RepID=A0A562ZSI7_9BURK|nr:zinc-binding protein [Caenimonas sedimenti]